MNKHIKGLGHIAILTQNMDKSVSFYRAIGGEVLQEGTLPAGEGVKRLVLVDFGGVVLELIERPNASSLGEGVIPHIAVYVDDVDAAAAAIREAGVDTFMTPEKEVLTDLFGGLENWFFTGPSGEQIELLKML